MVDIRESWRECRQQSLKLRPSEEGEEVKEPSSIGGNTDHRGFIVRRSFYFHLSGALAIIGLTAGIAVGASSAPAAGAGGLSHSLPSSVAAKLQAGYAPVRSKSGAVVGYIPAEDFLGPFRKGETIAVYASNHTTVVGHIVIGRGFVATTATSDSKKASSTKEK